MADFVKLNGYNVKDKDARKSITTLDLNRFLRTFEPNSNNPNYNNEYSNLQGGCYVGNDRMVIATILDNTTNSTQLREIDLNTGSVVRSATLQLEHGNSIAYNPNTKKLYIAGLYYGTNLSHNIYIVDYQTFVLDDTISLPLAENETTFALSFDIETETLYLLGETNNSTSKIYRVDIDTFDMVEIPFDDETGLFSTTYKNDIVVFDDTLYLMKFNPQILVGVNLTTGKTTKIYNIDEYTKSGNVIGELESISIIYDDDKDVHDLLLTTNHVECINGFYNTFQYFKANIKYNVCANIKIHGTQKLIVDINSNAINPDGSIEKPFKHLAEACNVARFFKIPFIEFKTGTYPYTSINELSNCWIRTYELEPNVEIQGIQITNSSNIRFSNSIKINNKYANQNYDINIERSKNISMSSLILGDALIHIRLYHSIFEFTYLTYTNQLFQLNGENIIECQQGVIKFNYTGDKPTLINPIKILDTTIITSSNTTIDLSVVKDVVKKDGTLKILAHGYYHYIEYEIPFNSGMNRNSSFLLENKLFSMSTIFNTQSNNVVVKLLRVLEFTTSGINDITANASIDIQMLYY